MIIWLFHNNLKMHLKSYNEKYPRKQNASCRNKPSHQHSNDFHKGAEKIQRRRESFFNKKWCVWGGVELGISMRRMKLDSCLSPVAKHVEQMDLEFKYEPKITGLLEENKEKVLEWASNSFWTNIQMTKKKMSRGSFAVAEETVCRMEETHWK